MTELHWISSTSEVDELLKQSQVEPVLLFKHSTSCPISHIAKHRVVQALADQSLSVKTVFLDLISYREVSNYIASTCGVVHESPQAILLQHGNAVSSASHLAIDPASIQVLATK